MAVSYFLLLVKKEFCNIFWNFLPVYLSLLFFKGRSITDEELGQIEEAFI